MPSRLVPWISRSTGRLPVAWQSSPEGPAALAGRRSAGWRPAATPSSSTTSTTSVRPSPPSKRSSPATAMPWPSAPTSLTNWTCRGSSPRQSQRSAASTLSSMPSAAGSPPTPVAEVDLDEFDALVRIDTRATFIVNREAARHLRNGGAIVNLSSSAEGSSLTAYGVYAATKAATDVLTRALALELRERDITVNAVCLEVHGPCVPGRVGRRGRVPAQRRWPPSHRPSLGVGDLGCGRRFPRARPETLGLADLRSPWTREPDTCSHWLDQARESRP